MAASFASNGVQEFELTLDEIERSLNFISAANKLRPRLSPVLNREVLQADMERLVDGFIKLKDVNLDHHYRGSIVVISGAFERLVRRAIEEAIKAINSAAASYDDVADGIKIQNLFFTGRALCSAKDPPDHLAIDTQRLIAQIATCLPGKNEFTLNADAFGMFITNLTPTHLSDVCRSIGVKLDWDYFGRLGTFEQLLGTKGTRATATAVSQKLTDLIRLRNRVAHTGNSNSTLAEESVADHIKFIRLFGTNLVTFIESQLPKPQIVRKRK